MFAGVSVVSVIVGLAIINRIKARVPMIATIIG
jgi:hypothetical protein